MLMIAPPVRHVAHRRLRAEERRAQVERHDFIPPFRGHLADGRAVHARGGVHQYVQAAEVLRHLIHEPRAGGGIAQVGREHDGLASRRRNGFRGLVRTPV